MKSSEDATANRGRLADQSKFDPDQLLADPSKITRVPVESLPELVAQITLRVGELKHLECMLLSKLFSHRTTCSQSSPDGAQLLSAAQVAEMFDVPETWVREQARFRKLPSVRLGHYVRFKREDMARFLEARTNKAD